VPRAPSRSRSAATPPDRPGGAPSFARNVAVLAACQALFYMANSVVISTSALVGLQYAPSESLSTLALGSQSLGTMLTTLPASLLMQRFGRKAGLAGGASLGIVAGLLATAAILRADFTLFCLAGLAFAAFAAFGQYYRFTAADAADAATAGDAAPTALRGRAIGWVMAGGAVAALAGPELAKRTRDLLAPVPFAGCFAAIVVLAALSVLVLTLLRLPPAPAAEREEGARPVAEIMRQPRALVAVLGSVVAYVIMNVLMTATPLAMIACGHNFADSAFVIQWHVLGMFAPSFVAGHLIARLGVTRVMAIGLGLLLACILTNLTGLSVAHFAAGLFLLGVGWNFLFVGSTTLLTTCHAPAEKAKVQGLNDLLIFATVTLSASLSGVLHHAIGWSAMNLAAIPALAVVGALLFLGRRRMLLPGAVGG
jgi:MFS family permease